MKNVQTYFITFGEAIQLVGFNKAAQMMRRALGIKTLAPWAVPQRKRRAPSAGTERNRPVAAPKEQP